MCRLKSLSVSFLVFVSSAATLCTSRACFSDVGLVFCFSRFWPVFVLTATLQVDPDAFDALIDCIAQGDLDPCEQVPSGDDDGFLINPIAGVGVNMGGPARYHCRPD